MQFAITLIIIFTLFAIAVQDFKQRSVSLFLFLVLFITLFLFSSIKSHFNLAVKQLFLNTFILILLLAVLLSLYYTKEKDIKTFFSKKLGVGDILFWICATPIFSMINFLLWFISSLLFCLLLYLFLFDLKKEESKTLPLAGLQALFLIIIIIINQCFFNKNFSQDIISITPFMYE